MKTNKWKGNTKLHGIFSIFNYNFWFANMCEKYQVRGEYCSPFDEMNGHCSCGPGLSWIYYSAPPRRIIPMPETRTLTVPWTFQCVPITPPRKEALFKVICMCENVYENFWHLTCHIIFVKSKLLVNLFSRYC